MTVSEDEIEAMVRELIERYVPDPDRKAALDWLDRRVVSYRAVQTLGRRQRLHRGSGATS